MKNASARHAVNAAIYFASETYATNRSVLMGRETASVGFLDGWVRHAEIETLYGYARRGSESEAFVKAVQAAADARAVEARVLPFDRADLLAQVGALFHPGPNIAPLAWTRRRYAQRDWSLVGVTHTTATERVMHILAQLLTSPLQPWDALVCPSNAVKSMVVRVLSNYGDYLREHFGARRWLPAFELPVIPLGADTVALDPATPAAASARAQWRAQLHIGPHDIAILWMGRFAHGYKANPWPMYLAAESAARSSARHIHLIEAGWYPDRRTRRAFDEAFAAAAPSVTRHELDGRKPDVRCSIWFAADVFCSLADNIQETFGLTPIEAMAAGLPVLVSDWDGYRDTVRDGVDGVRVPTLAPAAGAGNDLAQRYEADADDYRTYCFRASCATAVDVRAAGEALTALASSGELRARMAAAGRQRAVEVYDWRNVVREYQALLAALAAKRTGAAELCPCASGEAASPLRDDPFRLFETYPTRAIAHTDRIRLADGSAAAARARALLKLRVFRGALPLRPGLLELVARAAGESGGRVGDLLARLPRGASPADCARLLSWLAKCGLATIEPDPSSPAPDSISEAPAAAGDRGTATDNRTDRQTGH